MARISLNICDLCKSTTQDDLGTIKITFQYINYDKVKHEVEDQSGEICVDCYCKLSKQLNQEVQPIIPKAAQNTPSDKGAPPILIDQLDKKELDSEREPTAELLDGELNYIKSTFTDERKRQVMKELDSKCNHPRGFSMDETDGKGITCKDCDEKVKF